jgi:ADP-ribose pyrophosphatase YjhB (NUDIX family)/gluconate kinase
LHSEEREVILDDMNVVICTGGVPGSGKSTICNGLAALLGSRADLLVSEDVRRQFELGDPFSPSYRTQLHDVLKTEVRERSGRSGVVIVDSNLLERKARQLVLSGTGPKWKRIFIAPVSGIGALIQRVNRKFGRGYMYPPDHFTAEEVIDHSLAFGEVVYAEEASELFDAVLQVNTTTGQVQWWARSGSAALAVAMAELCRQVERPLVAGAVPEIAEMSIASETDSWISDIESDGLVGVLPQRPVTYHLRRSRAIDAGETACMLNVEGTLNFAKSYVGWLRSRVGPDQIIVPSVRVVIEDPDRGILLIRRSDSGAWALVGGSQELNESITEAARREVREETGLLAGDLELVAVHSDDAQVARDGHGNLNQGLAFVFRCKGVQGDLLQETSETTDAQWFTEAERPALSDRHERSLQEARSFNGTVVVH